MEIFVSIEVSGKVKPDVLPVTHPAQLVGQCWELRGQTARVACMEVGNGQ